MSLGIVWGAALFLTTSLSYFTEYGKLFLEVVPGSLYPGDTISPYGGLLSLCYGIADLLIVGIISGWLCDRFNGKVK